MSLDRVHPVVVERQIAASILNFGIGELVKDRRNVECLNGHIIPSR